MEPDLPAPPTYPPRPVVYTAGPFRGKNAWEVHRNVYQARIYAMNLAQLGYYVLCPHSNTAVFDGTLTDQYWLDCSLSLLSRCDCIFMIPGWANSEGATLERNFALSNSLTVLENMKAAKDYLDGYPT